MFYRKDNKSELLRNKNNKWVSLQIEGAPPLQFKESVIDNSENAIDKYLDNDNQEIATQQPMTLVYSHIFDPKINTSVNP